MSHAQQECRDIWEGGRDGEIALKDSKIVFKTLIEEK